jgi:uncharacterized Zn-finger protein
MINGSTSEKWIESVKIKCPFCAGGSNTNALDCKYCNRSGKLNAKLVIPEKYPGSTNEMANVYCPYCAGGTNTNALDCKYCDKKGYLMCERV